VFTNNYYNVIINSFYKVIIIVYNNFNVYDVRSMIGSPIKVQLMTNLNRGLTDD